MNKRPVSRAGVGASSILLIMVVLCLTAFGVLTLVSARVDEKLAERTAVAARAYYAADAAAQKKLAVIDAAIKDGADLTEIEGVSASGDTAAFSVPLGDGRTLSVTLSVSGGAYQIISYRTAADGNWGN